MADTKVTGLDAVTSGAPATDLVKVVHDVAGTPVSKKMTWTNQFGAAVKSVQSSANLIKNSPGQIVTDGAEPQWWDDVANATITDEDTAGEAPADIHARCFKVVTTADDVYGKQTLTFADEDLLDAGTTEVSLSCWVYCATGNKASIGIFGTNLTLQESSQAGAGAWELLTVENITLNAGDASIEIRLIVDTDTAWFTIPMLNVGAVAMPWRPRGQKFVPLAEVTQYDLNTTGTVAWSDTDCTANTHPLATAVAVRIYVQEPNGTVGSTHTVGHSDDLTGADSTYVRAGTIVLGVVSQSACARVDCNDSQVIRYAVNEIDADNDVRAILYLRGYWMWE